VFNYELLIQVIADYSFVALIAFTIAYVTFGSWSERLGGLILVQSHPYLILKEIYQFDFVFPLEVVDCC